MLVGKIEYEDEVGVKTYEVGKEDVKQILVNGAFSSNLRAKAIVSYENSKRADVINLDNCFKYVMFLKGDKGEMI